MADGIEKYMEEYDAGGPAEYSGTVDSTEATSTNGGNRSIDQIMDAIENEEEQEQANGGNIADKVGNVVKNKFKSVKNEVTDNLGDGIKDTVTSVASEAVLGTDITDNDKGETGVRGVRSKLKAVAGVVMGAKVLSGATDLISGLMGKEEVKEEPEEAPQEESAEKPEDTKTDEQPIQIPDEQTLLQQKAIQDKYLNNGIHIKILPFTDKQLANVDDMSLNRLLKCNSLLIPQDSDVFKNFVTRQMNDSMNPMLRASFGAVGATIGKTLAPIVQEFTSKDEKVVETTEPKEKVAAEQKVERLADAYETVHESEADRNLRMKGEIANGGRGHEFDGLFAGNETPELGGPEYI